MAENVFYVEIKVILDTLVKAAVDLLGVSGGETGNTTLKSGFGATVEMLSRETSRTICSVFSQMSSPLLSENSALKAQLELREAERQSLTKSMEDARRWRENVLSGCPVLFQQSGLLYRLKPFGRLMRRTDAQQEEEEPSPAAQADGGCDDAGRDSSGPNGTQEAATSSNRKLFVCDVCGKSFSRRLHLTKHADTHAERRPLAVTFQSHQEKIGAGPKTFKSDTSLTKHQLAHADICAVKTMHHLHAHEAVHATNKPGGETFGDAAALPSHQSGHTNEHVCTACGKAFTRRRSLRAHQAVHRGKTFTCEVCGMGFTFQHNLRRHMRLHTGEKPFLCKVCGRSFMHDNKLKAHMLLHGERKAFMCDLCGKTFLYNCQLRKHQRTHEERRGTEGRSQARGNRRVVYRRDKTTVDMTPFSCTVCRKSFDSAGSLRRHELIHTKNLQYTCDKCGKSFRYKATYQYHQRAHSGERPFACHVCSKTFIIRQALKSHMLQHSGEKPHKCQRCDRTFRIYTNLLRHQRVHTGEKPYECEECGTRFRQLGHVKCHMQVHTGDKPHSCSSCSRSFSDSRLLKRHKCRERTSGRSITLS